MLRFDVRVSAGVSLDAVSALPGVAHVTATTSDEALKRAEGLVPVQAQLRLKQEASQLVTVHARPGTSQDALWSALRTLGEAVPDVGAMPAAGGLPPALTPVVQTYLHPSDQGGVGAELAWQAYGAGAQGAGVCLADIEQGWHDHCAFPPLHRLDDPSVVQTALDHGTGVLGILTPNRGPTGLTGIVPALARVWVASYNPLPKGPLHPSVASRIVSAIARAVAEMSAGDVLLLEIQTGQPEPQGGWPQGQPPPEYLLPISWYPSVAAAIRFAVYRGIHVVEAAGNGTWNLDTHRVGGTVPFGPGRKPTGSVVVSGATWLPPGPGRKVAWFSLFNEGSVVDCRACGTPVYTAASACGLGHLDGTSAASAIVAGVVASVSGVVRARGGGCTPDQMRELLRDPALGSMVYRRRGISAGPSLGTAVPDLMRLIPAALALPTP